MRNRILIVSISIFTAGLTLLPYLWAQAGAGADWFTGFLMNPYDAASYLVKMRQGWDGDWMYTLAFTAAPRESAFLFTYYIALGHLARMLSLPLQIVFHTARWTGNLVFLLAAWEFFGRAGLPLRGRWIAWLMAAFGSGLGWLLVPAGYVAGDLWIAEAVPFVAMLISAHFPLAMAAQLAIAMRLAWPTGRMTVSRFVRLLVLGAALGMLQPFGIIPLGAAVFVWMLARRWIDGRLPEGAAAGLLAAGLGLAPYAAYALWVVQTLPDFASWSAQNLTPSPPVWDTALLLGVPGLLCVAALAQWLRAPRPAGGSMGGQGGGRKHRSAVLGQSYRSHILTKIFALEPGRMLLIFWFVINLILLYAPFTLQRRLMLGILLPLAALAAPYVERLLFPAGISAGRVAAAILLLPLSNFIVLAAIASSILARDPAVYLKADASSAVDWLAAHAAPEDVVLAPLEISRWIPGLTGLRVIYGHPMETVDSKAARRDMELFYGAQDADERWEILWRYHVRWVIGVEQEESCLALTGGEETFRAGNTVVCEVDG